MTAEAKWIKMGVSRFMYTLSAELCPLTPH